LISKGNWSMVY